MDNLNNQVDINGWIDLFTDFMVTRVQDYFYKKSNNGFYELLKKEIDNRLDFDKKGINLDILITSMKTVFEDIADNYDFKGLGTRFLKFSKEDIRLIKQDFCSRILDHQDTIDYLASLNARYHT